MKSYLLLNACILLGVASAFAQELVLETSVQTGHYDKITALAYSPDGKHIFSASADNTIKLWELSTRREVRTFTGFSRWVTHLAVSPDGKEFISICQDSLAWGWDPSTGQTLFKLRDTLDIINNAIYTPDGKYIITGGKKFSAAIWDRSTNELVRRLEGKGLGCYSGICAGTLSLTRDGRWLVIGLQDYFVEVWDLKDFSMHAQIKTQRGSCTSCTMISDVHPRNRQILSSSGRDSLRLWDMSTSARLPLQTNIEDVDKMGFSPSGEFVATMKYGTVRMTHLESGRLQFETGSYQSPVESWAFAPDGKSVALGGEDKVIRVREISTGREQYRLSGYASEVVDSLSQSVRYWARNITKQDLSPDGKLVAEPRGNRVLVWELNTGRVIKRFEMEESRVIAVAFSPGGEYLAAAGGDRTLRVWDLETGAVYRSIEAHGGAVFSIDFSEDGKYVVTGSWDATMRIWDLEKGTQYGIYRSHEVTPITVSFMPGSLYLITGGLDKRLLMTEVDTGVEVREFIGHRTHVSAIDYSPDGRYMVTGSWDELAKMWDLSTGLQVRRFAGHQGPIYDVAFSNAGSYVATASWDKSAKVWDPETGEELFSFEGNTGAVVSVNFTPDEKYLVTWTRSGETKVWDLKTGDELFTQIITGDDQWLIKTPEGYFYATDRAKNSIFFVRGMETYDIERFYDQFYKPGLLEQIYKGDAIDEGSLLNKLQEYPPPTIEIVGPEYGKLVADESVEVLYRVTNTGGGVDEVKIMSNGKRVLGEKVTEEKVQKKGRSMFRTVNVDLVPGNNVISISAFSHGRIESRAEEIEIIREGVPAKPRCFVLSIGINQYRNPSLNLNYARSDATSFGKTVKQNGRKLFERVIMYDLMDAEASREGIVAAINEIATESGPQDVFFMFYAGHGSVVNEIFYFIPSEVVRLYDESTLQNSAISDIEMQEMLREIKAQKQMIILDACHSGQSTEVLAARGSEEEKALAQLSRSAGVHVLAAAGSQQTATEFETLGHGLFTYLVLEALQGQADGAPRDGKVTVYELRSYIDNLVPEYAIKYKGAPQYPNTFSRGNDFPVIVH